MKNRFPFKLMLASLLVAAGAAMASTPNPAGGSTDAQIAQKVVHEIRMYPRYTIWDNIAVRVNNGDVDLQGQVSQPFKKADLSRIAQKVSGVRSVTNEIAVLPTSFFDDRIRLQVARAIYRDPMFSRYAIQAVPPIHIIVDNGHVTLEGVVNNPMEKNVAGIRAGQAGLSFGQVTNNLQVENPGKKG
ncbi:MAG: BON domain-containing protein [Acidobacteriia bacterium]|nr:BON domain-containing protein [Terriglobia bacterium]